MKDNILWRRSYIFAVDTCRLLFELKRKYHEYDITSQLIRSSTSIHANFRESQRGSSTRDFVAKLRISLKEAEESEFRIELLEDVLILEKDQAAKMKENLIEIKKLLTSIILTTVRKDAETKIRAYTIVAVLGTIGVFVIRFLML